MMRLLALSETEKALIRELQKGFLDFETMLTFINSKRDVSIAPEGVRNMVGYLRTIARLATELANAFDVDLQAVDPLTASDLASSSEGSPHDNLGCMM